MSDGCVAAGALQTFGFTVNYVAVDGRSDVLVTMTACGLDDLVVEVSNTNVVRVEAGREIEGMKKAVRSLNRVLADNVVWRMAIVAGGDGVVARLDPGVILRLHDVAVGAGLRIVGEIRVAFGVDKSVKAEPDNQSGENSKAELQDTRWLHLFRSQLSRRKSTTCIDKRCDKSHGFANRSANSRMSSHFLGETA